MRTRVACALACAVLFAACGGRIPTVPVNREQAEGIPRDVALQNLREVLPRADVVECRVPRAKLAQRTIARWDITDEGVTVHWIRETQALVLPFSSILRTELKQYGYYYFVQVYTVTTRAADHFRFWYTDPEAAKSVVELLESLRPGG